MKLTFLTTNQYKKMHKVKRYGRYKGTANPRFRDPIHFQLKNPAWLVCQGYAGIIQHSWLEYGGIVLDLFYNYRMNKELYYKVHHISGVLKFKPSECRQWMDLFRTYRFIHILGSGPSLKVLKDFHGVVSKKKLEEFKQLRLAAKKSQLKEGRI